MRPANSGSQAASSESRCDSKALYTKMLPLLPRTGHSEVMNSLPGIARIRGEELVVLGFGSGLSQHVNRPLKRNLVVRSHARKSRDRRVHRLEIHKEEWVLEPLQLLAEFGAEPGLPRLHASARTPLPLVQREVVRDVADGLDANLLQFLDGARLDSRQVADVVVWARRIAAVEELAGDGVGAMAVP